MVEIENQAFPLWVGCANYDGTENEFQCFIEPSKPFVRKIHRGSSGVSEAVPGPLPAPDFALSGSHHHQNPDSTTRSRRGHAYRLLSVRLMRRVKGGTGTRLKTNGSRTEAWRRTPRPRSSPAGVRAGGGARQHGIGPSGALFFDGSQNEPNGRTRTFICSRRANSSAWV